mmetsp:Transcript_19593/g.46559  ORF Transcript_19593/g.46559 Transcript_19593/m.46559 type:complete len:219 (-) Transcript_19593:687-1343(-)
MLLDNLALVKSVGEICPNRPCVNTRDVQLALSSLPPIHAFNFSDRGSLHFSLLKQRFDIDLALMRSLWEPNICKSQRRQKPLHVIPSVASAGKVHDICWEIQREPDRAFSVHLVIGLIRRDTVLHPLDIKMVHPLRHSLEGWRPPTHPQVRPRLIWSKEVEFRQTRNLLPFPGAAIFFLWLNRLLCRIVNFLLAVLVWYTGSFVCSCVLARKQRTGKL